MAKVKKHTKQTHIPTKWGIIVLVILMLVGIGLATYETNKQQNQTYRSDAAYSKPKPTVTPKPVKPRKCGGVKYGTCPGKQRCVDSPRGYRCK